MKDLQLYVHVVVKTLNLEISRVYLADYTSKNATKVRAAHVARLFYLIQPITSLFSTVVTTSREFDEE